MALIWHLPPLLVIEGGKLSFQIFRRSTDDRYPTPAELVEELAGAKSRDARSNADTHLAAIEKGYCKFEARGSVVQGGAYRHRHQHRFAILFDECNQSRACTGEYLLGMLEELLD
jgi:hypothetical protein